MTSETDLHAGLRAVAEQLDAAAGPTDLDAVVTGRRPAVRPRPTRPARLLAAAAAVVALLAGVVAVVATGDEDEGVKVDTPSTVTSTAPPGTTEPSTTDPTPTTDPPSTEPPLPGAVEASSYAGTAVELLPARGLAFVTSGRGGAVELTDLAGAPLATFDTADLPGVGDDPALPVLVGPSPRTLELGPVGHPEPDGCRSSGRGGVWVAICGDDQGSLVRRSPAGDDATLSGLPFGATVGRWRNAAVSPDGRWVLATFGGECEVPTAVLIPADGGEPRPADGQPSDTAATSYAVEWTDDGRAVVVYPDSACGTGDPEPGAYLVDPDTGERTVLRLGTFDRVLRWEHVTIGNEREQALTRAAVDLGVEQCCGEPAHNEVSVASGVVWDGTEVFVGGGDPGPITIDPGEGDLADVASGEVDGLPVVTATLDGRALLAFTCGGTRWLLGGAEVFEGAPPSANLLSDLASALIPRLSCTVGDPPAVVGG